jgi:RecJ-like exonuclease
MAEIGQRPKPKIITESKYLNSFDREGYERAECPRCHGTGRVDFKDCYRCARRGVVYILTND